MSVSRRDGCLILVNACCKGFFILVSLLPLFRMWAEPLSKGSGHQRGSDITFLDSNKKNIIYSYVLYVGPSNIVFFSNVMVCLPTSSVYFQTEADGKGQTFRSIGDTCAQLILYKTYPSSVFRELFFVRQLWLHYSLCFHLCNLITYLLVSCKNPSLSKPFNFLISFHIRCHIMPFPSPTVHHNCNKHVEINRKLIFFPKCLFI